MTIESQALLAILLYLSFFAWIGWRRGLASELVVFFTAVFGWVILQERGSIVVRLTNMVAGLAGVFAAEITGAEAAPAAEGDLVAAGTESGFLFLVWIVLVIFAYLVSSRPFFTKDRRHNGWAALVGVLNGYFFLAVLLPLLNALYDAGGGQISEAPLRGFVGLIVTTLNYLVDVFRRFWAWVSPINPVVLLFVLTLLLALIAMSLRRGARAR